MTTTSHHYPPSLAGRRSALTHFATVWTPYATEPLLPLFHPPVQPPAGDHVADSTSTGGRPGAAHLHPLAVLVEGDVQVGGLLLSVVLARSVARQPITPASKTPQTPEPMWRASNRMVIRTCVRL